MDYLPRSPDQQFKQYLYEHFSRVGKALSSPPRLVILNILCQGEHSVESLARESNLSPANVSRHLQLLKSVNLVRQRKERKFVLYSLADEDACHFFVAYRKFVHSRIAEIDTAIRAVHDSPSRRNALSISELCQELEGKQIFLVDVRPAEEYAASHLPGATSIPLAELKDRIGELPREKEIVTYCRGLFCILADQAVDVMLAAGFRANRLEGGVLEWKMAGHPLESS